jgi:predicted nucleic acid-binding Zn ribbon protein
LTRCPECGKKTLKKVYLPVGIVFKGSGFYATDHRSPSGGSKFGTHAESSGESRGGESTQTEGKSGEAKPASTASSGSASAGPAGGESSGSAAKAEPAK